MSNLTGAIWSRVVGIGTFTAVLAVSALAVPSAFAAAGTLSLLAGTGTYGTATAPGPATSSDFLDAEGVAVDHAGNVYFASSDDHEVFKVTPAGYLTVVAGTGAPGNPAPGPATSSPLQFPNGVALDSNGNLYIPDSSANEILKVTPTGVLSIVAGNGVNGAPTPGPALQSRLNGPADVKVDSSGNLYIADFNGNYVEKVTPSGTLSILAGTGTANTELPGPATASPLNGPDAVAVDSAGDVYIGDSGNNVVEEVTPGGTLSVVAGNHQPSVSTSGPATSRAIDYPAGLAVDSNGDLYVTANSTGQVDEVAGGQLTVIAGTGVRGPSTYGGAATSSELQYAFGVAVTPAGGVVFGDDGNDVVDLIGALITAPSPVTAPSISGTPAVGRVLTADPGTWLDYPTSYAYQWQECDSSGGSCVSIAGATSANYTVSTADGGHTIRVVVTATNGIGSTAGTSLRTSLVPSVSTTSTTSTTTTTPTPAPPTSTTTQPLAGVGLSTHAMTAGVSVSGLGGLVLPLVCPQTVSGCDADGLLTLALSTPASSHALDSYAAVPIKDSVLARFTGVQIQTGQSRLVSVKLTAAATRYLQTRGIRRVLVTLTINNHLSGGTEVTTQQQVWLNVAGLAAACPAAVGRITASGVAQMRLGLVRSRAARLGPHRRRPHGFVRYCLTGGAIRVAYTNRMMLRLDAGATVGKRPGHVALVLTGNVHYSTHGIHVRMTVKSVAARLNLGRGLVIGRNTWYFVPGTKATIVLKTRGGLIREIGVASLALTRTSAQQLALLSHP